MKKLLLLLGVVTLADAFTSVITDPVTSSYYVTITNNTDINMRLSARNLGQTIIRDPNRAIAVSNAVWPDDVRFSSIPAHTTKSTALAVRNHQQGYLDLTLDDNGTSFRVSQDNNANLGRNSNCFPTGGIPTFACFQDISSANSPAIVKYSKVQNTSCFTPGCSSDVYLEIIKRKE